LTDNYREVYEHLASGAQTLCKDKPAVSRLDLPEQQILTASGAPTMHDLASPSSMPQEAGVDHQAEPTDQTRSQQQDAPLAKDEHRDEKKTHSPPSPETQAEAQDDSRHDSKEAPTTSDTATAEDVPGEEESNKSAAAPAQSDSETPPPASEVKNADREEDDVHLGVESAPGSEIHKTHRSIH
jgi:hypothetical protein